MNNTGAVVLFHGLAANKYIMTYLARSFAQLGLTVFLPDLPGHGRTPGPFTPQRAEDCAASLLRGLEGRGMIVPERTILAGHSMGAAIALRVAPGFRPAGVIALSPAPMKAEHGVTPEKMLFQNVPPILPNTLISAGKFEPEGLAANAADLVPTSNTDPTIRFYSLPGQSHVSVLFSPGAARMCQTWAAGVLHLPNPGGLPTRLFLLGGMLGFVGILVLAGPFLRELTTVAPDGEARDAAVPSPVRTCVEVLGISLIAVSLLRYLHPLKMLGLFEGDYLAGFFLLVGLGLIALHPKLALRKFRAKPGVVLAAGFAALILHLLVTGWFDLTITGAWLNLQRWERFPVFFVAAFLFLYGLETVLGPVSEPRQRLRLDLLGDSAGVDVPGNGDVPASQRADSGGAAGALFCVVLRTLPSGCKIGTVADGVRHGRRGLRCYTLSGFLPGALSRVLGAAGQPMCCPVPPRRRWKSRIVCRPTCLRLSLSVADLPALCAANSLRARDIRWTFTTRTWRGKSPAAAD